MIDENTLKSRLRDLEQGISMIECHLTNVYHAEFDNFKRWKKKLTDEKAEIEQKLVELSK